MHCYHRCWDQSLWKVLFMSLCPCFTTGKLFVDGGVIWLSCLFVVAWFVVWSLLWGFIFFIINNQSLFMQFSNSFDNGTREFIVRFLTFSVQMALSSFSSFYTYPQCCVVISWWSNGSYEVSLVLDVATRKYDFFNLRKHLVYLNHINI